MSFGMFWMDAGRFGETMELRVVSQFLFRAPQLTFLPERHFSIETYWTKNLSLFVSQCRRGRAIRKRAMWKVFGNQLYDVCTITKIGLEPVKATPFQRQWMKRFRHTHLPFLDIVVQLFYA